MPPTLWGESTINTRSKSLFEDVGVVKEDSSPQLSALHGPHDDRTGLTTSASAVSAQDNPLKNKTWKSNQVEGIEMNRIVAQEHELVETAQGSSEVFTAHGHRLDSRHSDTSTRYTESEMVMRELVYISTTVEYSSDFPSDHQEFAN